MSSTLVKILVTAIAGAVGMLAHTGLLPIPIEVMDPLMTFVVGWLHVPQPGAK